MQRNHRIATELGLQRLHIVATYRIRLAVPFVSVTSSSAELAGFTLVHGQVQGNYRIATELGL